MSDNTKLRRAGQPPAWRRFSRRFSNLRVHGTFLSRVLVRHATDLKPSPLYPQPHVRPWHASHLKLLPINVVAGVAGFLSMLHLSHPLFPLGEDGKWTVDGARPGNPNQLRRIQVNRTKSNLIVVMANRATRGSGGCQTVSNRVKRLFPIPGPRTGFRGSRAGHLWPFPTCRAIAKRRRTKVTVGHSG
jgi:hypothetical protein